MRRRRRTLTPEESELWARVKATAEPLRPTRPETPEEPASGPAGAEKTKRKTAASGTANLAIPKKPSKPRPAPPAPALDRKTVRNITRGHVPVEKRLDLHGMTQTHAHRRLKRFLEEAQASGVRTVLVITGKGGGGPDEPSWDHTYQGRGILRRSVPDWLRSPEFRGLTAGFSEASRRHGGGGALYVRVKRRS